LTIDNYSEEAPHHVLLVGALTKAGLTPRQGDLLTLDRPLHRAAPTVDPSTGPLAVDMESARWAQIAAAAGARFGTARVISDRADLPLPRPRHELLGSDGTVRWISWLQALLATGHWRSPLASWRDLQRARADWTRACSRLDRVATALVAACIGAEPGNAGG